MGVGEVGGKGRAPGFLPGSPLILGEIRAAPRNPKIPKKTLRTAADRAFAACEMIVFLFLALLFPRGCARLPTVTFDCCLSWLRGLPKVPTSRSGSLEQSGKIN